MTQFSVFDVLNILHETSQQEVQQRSRASQTAAHRRAMWWVWTFAVAPLILALAGLLAGWQTGRRDFMTASLWLVLLAYVGVILYPLVVAVLHRHALKSAWRHPFGLLLNNVESVAAVDVAAFAQLSAMPLDALELAHLEMRHEREYFERRLTAVVGAVDKIGLAPGLLAVLGSLAQLPQKIGTPQFLVDWLPPLAYALALLYVMAFLMQALLMRLDRLTRLLELVIARQKTATAATGGRANVSRSRPVHAARRL